MINFKKYYDDLNTVAPLFYAGLLHREDIFEIANILTTLGNDNEFLINILLDGKDSDDIFKNFELFLRVENLNIVDKDIAVDKLIVFIFEKILAGEADFYSNLEFVIYNLIRNSGNYEDYSGQYFGISNLVGIYYDMEYQGCIDSDCGDLEEEGRKYMKEYLESYRKKGFVEHEATSVIDYITIDKKRKYKKLALLFFSILYLFLTFYIQNNTSSDIKILFMLISYICLFWYLFNGLINTIRNLLNKIIK